MSTENKMITIKGCIDSNEQLHGKIEMFREDQTLYKTSHYNHGLLNGRCNMFDDKGFMCTEVKYFKNNEADGRNTKYFSHFIENKRSVREIRIYTCGIMHTIDTYEFNGNQKMHFERQVDGSYSGWMGTEHEGNENSYQLTLMQIEEISKMDGEVSSAIKE